MTITVYAIDDHAVVLQGYHALLEECGIVVVGAASSFDEALAAYPALRPRVVVTDLAMSNVHGLEGIERLREQDPHARVLVVSMHDDVVLAARALRAGAIGYITKTAPLLQLVDGVRHVADGLPFLSPDIALKLAAHQLDGETSLLQSLSDREFECFRLLAEGWSIRAIATRMGLSLGGAANLKSRLMRKLGATSDVDLIRLGIERGVVRQNV